MAATLIINFTRPEKTAQVLKALMDVPDLFIYRDGPKKEKDPKRVEEVGHLIEACAQWRKKKGMETHTLLEKENKGTKEGPLAALRWVFSQREEAHIFEDDILPCPNFHEAHEEGLQILRGHPELFCVAEGHPLPQCNHRWIPTQMARLVAWSTRADRILPLIEKSIQKPLPWETHGNRITEGLHPKTRVFLWKEFRKLSKNPEWSWHYTLMQTQLLSGLKGLTPTTRLHHNTGIDGSGNNCINLFGEDENFSVEEIDAWKEKQKYGEDPQSERKMETARYGRIRQSIGRKLYRITPSKLKKIWRPIGNSR